MKPDAKKVWDDVLVAYDAAMSIALPRGHETQAPENGRKAAISIIQKALDDAVAEEQSLMTRSGQAVKLATLIIRAEDIINTYGQIADGKKHTWDEVETWINNQMWQASVNLKAAIKEAKE